MANIPAQGLTIGGLFVGLAIPTLYCSRWAVQYLKSKKSPDKQEAVGLGVGILYGGLATMCTGGLIGFGAGVITWLGNGAGSLTMWGLTGGNTTLDARSTTVTLTGEGNLILLLLTVVIIGAWRALGKKMQEMAKRGIVSGILLGLSATLGGAVAAFIIPAVNNWGAQIVGSIA
ncbi:hypothetical protein [Streptomyces palmae]|uniref:Uncharacterized protein n=1 Tax=Streptomyces palmae TaxID=1701085 RepID=A0A4Z0HBN3_9ACTN|nr:hypothetical protein [Streptomyces palmae]TGB14607.1 hypothetical protein E4099_08210 [Streptomyces palmae]